MDDPEETSMHSATDDSTGERTESPSPGRGSDLGAVLRAALEESEDVTSSARSRVDQTLKGRSVTSTVTDIAGAGLATVWHLLTGVPDPADSNDTEATHD